MEVLVFVTNVLNHDAVGKIQPLLAATPAITQWNFDLEDCDHILRVVSDDISPRKVESLLNAAGFDCYELEY